MKKLLLITVLLSLLNNSEGFSQPCLPDGIIFTSQAQIDSFQVNYPNCTEIEGFVIINGNDIVDLSGLQNVTSIGRSLTINGNTYLTSLTGLNNLTTISGSVLIRTNPSLNSLSGLEKLISIGGWLTIKWMAILPNLNGLNNLSSISSDLKLHLNDSLKSLTGLDNLTSVNGNLTITTNRVLSDISNLNNLNNLGGYIWISENNLLKSLNGLDSINPNSINELAIYENETLSDCDILSICGFLLENDTSSYFYDNATGCNSQEEVEEACMVSVNENELFNNLKIYPNPSSNQTTIEYSLNQPQTVTISFYNQFGKQVDIIKQDQSQGLQKVVWTPENLVNGVYYFRLQAGEQVASGKVVLMK